MYPRRADKFKCEPLEDCPRCKGKGTYLSGNKTTEPCLCIFLSGSLELRRDAVAMFGKAIRNITDKEFPGKFHPQT